MKRRILLLAVVGFHLIRVEPLWAQVKSAHRLLFDQAHGEQAPPPQLSTVAEKLGLEVQTSAEPITSKVLDGNRIL